MLQVLVSIGTVFVNTVTYGVRSAAVGAGVSQHINTYSTVWHENLMVI